MYYLNNFCWLPLLDSVTKAINRNKSVSLKGYSAQEVVDDPKIEEKLKRMFAIDYKNHFEKHEHQPILKPGDLVRVIVNKNIYAKGYEPSFSDSVEKIEKVRDSAPPQYFIENSRKPYYIEQLRKVLPQNSEIDSREFIVEKRRVLKGRELRNGSKSADQTEYLIRSIYNRKEGKWVSEEKLQELKDGFKIFRDDVV